MTINNLNKICTHSIYFDFYNLKVKVNVLTDEDVKLLTFQYQTFITKPHSSPSIEYYFITKDESIGFFEAIFNKKNKLLKEVYIQNKELTKYSSFTDWSDKTTPFPPFIFEPLKSNYLYLQGSSITYNNKAISFLGRPFNGKSTLANWSLSLIENTAYLADDITIVSIDSLIVKPYQTSSGIRKDANAWFKKINKIKSKITTVSEVTGLVEYHRIEDTYGDRLGSEKELSTIFILSDNVDKNKNYTIEKLNEDDLIELEQYRLPINNIDTLALKHINIYKIDYNLQEVNKEQLIREIEILIK